MINDQRNLKKAPKDPLPHPWPRIALGFALCLIGAALCGVLILNYLRTRPTNFCENTATWAEAFEQILVNSGVPPDAIQRTGPQLQQDARRLWYSYEFDVQVPEAVNFDHVIGIITEGMALAAVYASVTPDTGNVREMRLTFGPHDFLTARMEQKIQLVDLTAACPQIADKVQAFLAGQGIAPEDIRRAAPEPKQEDNTIWTCTQMEAPLPAGRTGQELQQLLQDALAESTAQVALHAAPEGGDAVTLAVAYKGVTCVELALQPKGEKDPPPAEPPAPPVAPSGPSPAGQAAAGATKLHVAILVDDGGYNQAVGETILALTPALTLSILPDTPFATRQARRGAELGFEVMAHIPMQPAHVTDALTTKMGREEIQKRTKAMLAQIPGAKGVNNHIGSVFTEDERAMTDFLEEIKGRPLYFIDSRTTAHSKAYETAKKLGIPTASRDVFLDVEPGDDFFRRQFKHLIEVAKKDGAAIAICHFRPPTARLLIELLPDLEKNGIQLVHASELVK